MYLPRKSFSVTRLVVRDWSAEGATHQRLAAAAARRRAASGHTPPMTCGKQQDRGGEDQSGPASAWSLASDSARDSPSSVARYNSPNLAMSHALRYHSRGPDSRRPTKNGRAAAAHPGAAALACHHRPDDGRARRAFRISAFRCRWAFVSRSSRSVPGSTSFSPSAGARAYACRPSHAGLLLAYDMLPAGRAALPHGRAAKSLFLPVPGARHHFGHVPARCAGRCGWALIAFCCATLLAFEHLPLPWKPGEELELPERLYRRHVGGHRLRRGFLGHLCAAHRRGGAPDVGRTDGHRTGAGPRTAAVGARRPGRRRRA